MPLHRRVPKRGFTNIFRREYGEVNLQSLNKLEKIEVHPKDMVEAGLVKKESQLIKILGEGNLRSAKTIYAHKFSQSARKKIEEAGGKAILIGSE